MFKVLKHVMGGVAILLLVCSEVIFKKRFSNMIFEAQPACFSLIFLNVYLTLASCFSKACFL